MRTLNRNQKAAVHSQRILQWLVVTLTVSQKGRETPRRAKGNHEALCQANGGEKEQGRMEGRQPLGRSCFLLLGTGNVLFHVVKCTLGDALLENQIL